MILVRRWVWALGGFISLGVLATTGVWEGLSERTGSESQPSQAQAPSDRAQSTQDLQNSQNER